MLNILSVSNSCFEIMASSLKRTISGVWTYFSIDELDDSIAVCNIEKRSAKSRRVRRAPSGAEKKHARQKDCGLISVLITMMSISKRVKLRRQKMKKG